MTELLNWGQRTILYVGSNKSLQDKTLIFHKPTLGFKQCGMLWANQLKQEWISPIVTQYETAVVCSWTIMNMDKMGKFMEQIIHCELFTQLYSLHGFQQSTYIEEKMDFLKVKELVSL